MEHSDIPKDGDAIRNRIKMIPYKAEFVSPPMYFVYVRSRDPSSIPANEPSTVSVFEMLKYFDSQESAQSWIEQCGAKIIKSLENNCSGGRPFVLTIIKYDNSFNSDDDCWPISHDFISVKEHPTFAFSRKAYKMLLDEHIAMIKEDWTADILPWWIHRCKNSKMMPISSADFTKILSSFEYADLNKYKKQEWMADYEKFVRDGTIPLRRPLYG